MTAVWIGLAIILVIILLIARFIIGTYNKVKKSKVRVDEAFAGVDVHLEERFDLLTKLVSTAKEESDREIEFVTEVTKIRSQYDLAQTIGEKIELANQVERLMPIFQATRENYPNPNFNEAFRQVQLGIFQIEDKLQAARRNFNAAVRKHNEIIVVFPANIIASSLNFKELPMFEADEAKKEDIDLDSLWEK